MTEQRPARPGEMCTCGHPAVLVFVFEDSGIRREVPWCGVERPVGTDREDED